MAKNTSLRPHELSDEDWAAIELVTRWLSMYRQATEKMSSTSNVTLSYAHRVFHKLQAHVRDALRDIPKNAPPQLKRGLVRAHRKLSDYHVHFDESPFYLWAGCTQISMTGLFHN